MAKHKFTPSIRKWISAVAKQLPPEYYHVPQHTREMGHKILEKDPKATDQEGEPIKPDIEYTRTKDKAMPVNHRRRMKDRFLKDGREGVEKYAAEVLSRKLKKDKETKELEAKAAALREKMKDEKDNFFQYGNVKKLEEIERQIKNLKEDQS